MKKNFEIPNFILSRFLHSKFLQFLQNNYLKPNTNKTLRFILTKNSKANKKVGLRLNTAFFCCGYLSQINMHSYTRHFHLVIFYYPSFYLNTI